MNWLNQTSVSKTFNWLNATKAQAISAIIRRHGGKPQRLAQERGALGYCKIVAQFAKGVSWAANVESLNAAIHEIETSGLTTQLTYQN